MKSSGKKRGKMERSKENTGNENREKGRKCERVWGGCKGVGRWTCAIQTWSTKIMKYIKICCCSCKPAIDDSDEGGRGAKIKGKKKGEKRRHGRK